MSVLDHEFAELAEHDSEGARVETWRLKRALDMGYSVEIAEKIAASRIDLHRLEAHLRRGCARLVAYRIEA